jgi:membrane protein
MLHGIVELFKEVAYEWHQDRVPRLGAALAYYSVFSIAPLLIIAVAITAVVFGGQAQSKIIHEIEDTVGEGVAQAIQDITKGAGNRHTGIVATVLGVVTLLFGASGVFGQLQDSLNTIWRVTPPPGATGVWQFIKDRFLSFTMVLGTGFLLLVSLVVTAALEAANKFLPAGSTVAGVWIWQIVNNLISFLVITLLFAMIFKILPQVKLTWRDVWVGALVTAVLFTLGKYLIGLYLGHAGVASTYGAAGSLVIILIWVYYSSQILLFGAEFTRVYAQKYGSKKQPAEAGVQNGLSEADRPVQLRL